MTCRRDGAQVRESVEKLATEPGLLDELMRQWDSTAEFLGELISIMACAHERFAITAKELGIGIEADV